MTDGPKNTLFETTCIFILSGSQWPVGWNSDWSHHVFVINDRQWVCPCLLSLCIKCLELPSAEASVLSNLCKNHFLRVFGLDLNELIWHRLYFANISAVTLLTHALNLLQAVIWWVVSRGVRQYWYRDIKFCDNVSILKNTVLCILFFFKPPTTITQKVLPWYSDCFKK